jgi:radical SAM protein with 4Fe4S-binding SPASM domain
MKKRFKKIYIEITNKCNLNCSFCSSSKRNKKEMSVDRFKEVISKIKNYTDYIYLHIKGEPLLHSRLNEILDICNKENIKVNITTNGTFLRDRKDILLKYKCVRQINVSLHSENNQRNYFKDVFNSCKELSNKIYICYRLWTLDDYILNKESTFIVEKIKEHYNLSTDIVDKLLNDKNIKIFNNTFVNKNNLFDWPDINKNLNIDGKCYGLIDQLGILSDGTVVPCCLDSEGYINLGNIFESSLEEILNTDLVKNIINGFKNNKSFCDLCKNCNFRNRFENN